MTGWTWDQCRDQLDLPRVYALKDAWRDNPPLAVTMRLAAEAMGVEFSRGSLLGKAGGSTPAVPDMTMADPNAIMAQLGQSEPVKYDAPRRGVIFNDP